MILGGAATTDTVALGDDLVIEPRPLVGAQLLAVIEARPESAAG